MSGADPLALDAVDLSEALARGALSAEELMQATLARIEAENPRVNAIVALRDAEDLLAEARAADAAPRRGWLHGVPLAVKDLANAAGLPTSMGSPLFAGEVAKTDDLPIARLRAAGAIVIGKTNTPEFGLGSHSFNPVFGVTRNPYDTARTAGGSSGGAAAALATRMVAVADGSDMMGSLRNPAAFCNVYGFRPSWGRVPGEPEGDSFLHQLATAGPMARSPADLAGLLETMAGRDPRQPHGLPAERFSDAIGQDVRGRRIGWLGDWGGAYALEPGIAELCEAALQRFEDLGAQVEPLAPPFPAGDLWQSWTTLRAWAVAAALAELYACADKRAQIKPEALWEAERGLKLSAMEVHRASVIRSRWFAQAASLFERFDALALPSAQVWPFPADRRWPERIGTREMDTYHRWMEVVVPASLAGLPALAVPAGFGAAGLPMGLQLVGPRGADADLLALGHAYHEATRWPQRHPSRA
ncbi:amidase [Rhodosalinus halophilus]|uniref:Amidase n=1 Tax=Rhodosalinus halophilus TaxID=2259333 RepID=A0A365UCJ3_9RHOB|nr:amidase [Rhodosalinus halophilus]RBI87119.1 amidase [Rhodosalinus halophilus]